MLKLTMKKNQKGLSLVEVFILFLVICLLGGGAWYVWNKRSDETKDWKTYSKFGISFKYPSNWTLKLVDSTQTLEPYQRVDIYSDDYEYSDDDEYIPVPDDTFAGGEEKGAVIYVSESHYSVGNLTADNFKEKFLDNSPNRSENFKVIDVNGHQAVQFNYADYVVRHPVTEFFLSDGKVVGFWIDTWTEETDLLDVYMDVYNKVVRTVTY